MIEFQCKNRHLINDKDKIYGLFSGSQNQWLDPQGQVENYSSFLTVSLFFNQEIFQYKAHYRSVNVALSTGERISMLSAEGDSCGSISEQLRVKFPQSVYFKLQRPTLEYLLDNENVWNVLKDLTVSDALRFDAKKEVIEVQTVNSGDSVLLNVDFYKPLSENVAILCRRLGLRQRNYSHTTSLLDDTPLDDTKSLKDQTIHSNAKIILHTHHTHPSTVSDIWDEPQDETTLKFTETSFNASVNRLIQILTAENHDFITVPFHLQAFTKTFLLTYSTFLTDSTLIEKLIERYSAPRLDMKTSEFEQVRSTIQLRVSNVLLLWAKKYPYAFVNTNTGLETSMKVLSFLDSTVQLDIPIVAKQIRKILVAYIKIKGTISVPFYKEGLMADATSDMKVFAFSAQEIAEHLTLIEWHYFSCIQV